MEDSHGNLLPLAPLVRAGIHPQFKVGTDRSPRDGGYLRLPDGRRIQLIFEKEMWYLPTWTAATGARARRSPKPETLTVSRNIYDVLNNEEDEACAEPDLPLKGTDETADKNDALRAARDRGDILVKQLYDRVELEIRKWCHPGPTKRREIMDYYPHLFPASRDFRRLFLEYVSPVDALMKGHRSYRKTARLKKLKAVKVRAKIERSRRRIARRQANEDDSELLNILGDEEDFDFPNPPDTITHSFLAEDGGLHEDDFLYAFQQELAEEGYDLHVDHAHAIAVGICSRLSAWRMTESTVAEEMVGVPGRLIRMTLHPLRSSSPPRYLKSKWDPGVPCCSRRKSLLICRKMALNVNENGICPTSAIKTPCFPEPTSVMRASRPDVSCTKLGSGSEGAGKVDLPAISEKCLTVAKDDGNILFALVSCAGHHKLRFAPWAIMTAPL